MREERPDQEDLTIPDDDRTLWQMQQNRADTAKAWTTYQLDRGLVPLPPTHVSRVLRDRDKNHQDNNETEEQGDT